MKFSCLSETSRSLWILAGSLALIALSFPSAIADERQLTDADIQRYLPRLRAEAAAFTKSVGEALETSAAVTSWVGEQEKLYSDFASGRKDVLTWIRTHTDHAVTPDGAVYSAECSRAITLEGVAPTAVFSFGKESPYRDLLRRAASGDEEAREEVFTRRGEEEMGEGSSASQGIKDFVAGIVSFYRKRGFVEADEDHPVTVAFLLWPDRSLTTTVWEMNAFSGLLPRSPITACAALPTGPLLEIRFEGESSEEMDASVQEHTESGGSEEEKADPEYEAVKEALLLAGMDARNPSQIEVPIPSDAPPEVKAQLGSVAAQFQVRKANVLVYKRHEAEIAPILKAFLQTSEE